MNRLSVLAAATALAVLFTGCVSPPPGAERGPQNTIVYSTIVEASPPGARIEINGRMVGSAPINLKFFGDINGKFHDFGFPYYIVRALPVATNQFAQTRLFRTGKDHIPDRIDFAMNQPSPNYVPVGPVPPGYLYPSYGAPIYYYPASPQ